MSNIKTVFAITLLSLAMVFSSALFSGNIVFATDYEPNTTYTISKPYQLYQIEPRIVRNDILRGPFTISVSGSFYYDHAYVTIYDPNGGFVDHKTIDGGRSVTIDGDYKVFEVQMIPSEASIYLTQLSDHTITINEAESGTATADKAIANLGTTVTLTATPADGYEFDSWDVKDASQNSITVTDNTFSMPDADVTVTPVFKAIPEYTVSFDGNGGSGTMESAKVREGEEYTLPDCGFTAPSGKEFDKWDKGAVGSKITVTGDVVVTAQWKDVPSEGGTDTDSDSKGESSTETDSNTDKGGKSESETKDSTSPKTGDESNIMFWSMLAILSLGGLTGLGIKRKRIR